MDTPTFAIIAIVLLTFAIFGPKPSFKREKQPKPIKVKRVERASSLTPIVLANRHSEYPAQTNAAARAPSPLQVRRERSAPQFALSGKEAPLPHEFSR